MHSGNKAFSLVELSIVLVILGLLTGGILAGQSLIRAAELRSFNTDYGRFNTALNSFRDKYFALPGDMRNATSFWGDQAAGANACASAATADGTPGTCDGNGDGKIIWNYATGENLRAWQQLAMAGLIEGSYAGSGETVIGATIPASKINNGGYVLAWSIMWGNLIDDPSSLNRIIFGGPRNLGAGFTILDRSVLSTEEAWNIDTKMDDGMPRSGKIIAVNGSDSTALCNGSTADAPYTLTSKGLNCYLVSQTQ